MRNIRFLLTIIAVAGLLWSCNEETSPTGSDGIETLESVGPDELVLERGRFATFEVTIKNLAPATGPGASQPLSPPVLATHRKNAFIFRTGRRASTELGQLAEDAFSDPLVTRMENSNKFHDVAVGGGVILPGDSTTITIEADTRFSYLSLVSMLVNTNDAFAGLNHYRLSKYGTTTVYLNTYDAGTEVNTERHDHIPGPCCGNPFVRVPSRDKVRLHPGLHGNGDLDPAIYGWTDPIAKVTIKRVP